MVHAPVWMMFTITHLAPAIPLDAVPRASSPLLGQALHLDLGGAPARSARERFMLAPALLTPDRLAQRAPAPPAAPGATPPVGPVAVEAAPAEPACDVDCQSYQEAQRAAREVLRSRTRVLRTHRTFAIAAWGSLLVTEALGTIQAVNQDTWFGRGNCSSDPLAFGCRQSSLITGLHEGFAFTTVGLYLTAGVLAASVPDPEHASEGEGGAEGRLRLHKTLAWVHAGGMILMPILGILSAFPQILGVTSDQGRADVGRAMRSIHAIVGYSTFAAFTAAGILEF